MPLAPLVVSFKTLEAKPADAADSSSDP